MAGSPDFLWLLDNEELLQLMLFACPDGVVVADRGGKVMLYTGSSESIFGFAPIEVLRREASGLFASNEEWEEFSAGLGRDGSVKNMEMQALHKDGEPFWVAVSASILRDRYGDMIGTVLYVRDHSTMRQIQNTLHDRNRQLHDLVEELDFLARHDQLTGLLNRGSAMDAAQKPLVACGLTGRPFSVAVFDIDHFKKVNDAYGHLAGDEVLHSLAGVMRQAARSGDIIGRFGGEEFVLFLPGATLEQAVAVAERVRVLVKESRIPIGDGVFTNVTVSAGVADIPGSADALREAIRVADSRLYMAKRAGRDRVAWSDAGAGEDRERDAA
ncbi:MAG: sensor domain-containing diguanylate cyclase [Thermoflexaceae bacterium]|nr:sensor domain-containing diguanylate cyclase [Thermoflexaceae bacterium]